MSKINTILGERDQLSCGEVTVPTYYGVLVDGDAEALIAMGYSPDAKRASGIRQNGRLVVWHGQYYGEIDPPACVKVVNGIAYHPEVTEFFGAENIK